MLRRKVYLLIICFAALCVSVAPAGAGLYTFDDWGWVTGVPGGTIMNQLSVVVTDEGVGADQVLFTFSNSGAVASSITDIYFDDGALLGIAGIVNGPGVFFGYPATPGDLPGGSSLYPPFQTSSVEHPVLSPHFSADSEPGQPGVMTNGVNPGESVGIVFDLQDGKTFDHVIDAINVGFSPSLYYDGTKWLEDSLRIGVHVQGIASTDPSGGSQAYILTPAPAAVILGMLGLGAAGLKLRKFV